MRKIMRAAAALLAAAMVFCLAGCSDPADARIYFELERTPATVDPQTASTDAELMLVRNLFEGLLRKDASGVIQPGAAERFTVDGLTYTFYLRTDICWENGDPVTAEDFVFGLRRAVLPKTQSPFVSRLFSIAGAEDVYNGRADVNSLAVSAIDAHTLTVTLCRQDDSFTETLTTAPCMPCNEVFFDRCVGKYGLERSYVLANGSYYMSKWDKENFGIRLYRNEKYKGDFAAKNGGVFFSCSEEEDALTRLTKNSVDAAFLDSSLTAEAESRGFSVTGFQNICWVLTVSGDFNADLRRSLMMLIDSSVYAADLPEGCTPADSLFPSALDAEAAVSGAGLTAYAREGAKSLFSAAIAQMPDQRFPQTTLTYCQDDGMKPVITDIVAHWQQNLSAFINIEAVDSSETLLSQLTQPTLQLAFFPVSAANTSTAEYLRYYGVDDMTGGAAAVQTALLSDHRLVPIAFENTCLAFSDAVTGIYSESGNGYLDFSFAVKSE